MPQLLDGFGVKEGPEVEVAQGPWQERKEGWQEGEDQQEEAVRRPEVTEEVQQEQAVLLGWQRSVSHEGAALALSLSVSMIPLPKGAKKIPLGGRPFGRRLASSAGSDAWG